MEVEILGMNFGCVLDSLFAGEFPHKECLLPLISKILGYCIVAASTTVKLPQIIRVLKNSSVEGLSVAAFELEVVGYTIGLAYCVHQGLPFSAYGEYAFLLIQAISLVAIIYYYLQPLGVKTWMTALLYCGLAPTVLAGQINPVLFEFLNASQYAIFFCARVPQIWKNFKIISVAICVMALYSDSALDLATTVCFLLIQSKGTGELSFLTFFMNFGGSIVRVFTSVQENAPLSMVGGSLLGVLLNGTILSQILLYRKPSTTKEKKTH